MEIKLTTVESQLIVAALTEASQASKDLQVYQQTLQEKIQIAVASSKVAERVYKAVMILRNLNPDAFQITWDEAKNEITIQPKLVQPKEEKLENIVDLPKETIDLPKEVVDLPKEKV
jgi:hypothetical protein